jgi:sterol 14-demethylase
MTSSTEKHGLPPSLNGWPLVGNFPEYMRDHVALLRRGYARLGPVFALRLGPQRAVMLVGPEFNRFFFTQADKLLSVPEVYRFVVPMFGPVLNAAVDRVVRRSQLALLHSAFVREALAVDMRVMEEETNAWTASLGDAGSFEIYEAFSGLVLRITLKSLLGPEIRERVDEFAPLLNTLAEGMDFLLPPHLPLPKFYRRDRAREALIRIVAPLVDDRLSGAVRHGDFLQKIVAGDYLSESSRSRDTIIDLVLMTAFTGYITTAAQMCWSLTELIGHPDYERLVTEEIAALPTGEPFSFDTLSRLTLLERAIKEGQRLNPAMSHYARFTAMPYEIGGFVVPKGWLTMISPTLSHRLPAVFPRPNVYDPDRFAPGREEDVRTPYSLIGFGGGVYRCPGAKYGMAAIHCVLASLYRNFLLELVTGPPVRDFQVGVIRPRPPCVIAYRRRRTLLPRQAQSTVTFGRKGPNEHDHQRIIGGN